METKSSPGPGQISGNVWRLLVLHCADRAELGRSVVLGSERRLRLTRGTAADGTFGLADSEVSREHAELSRPDDDGAWSLRDLGSRNGTFVCGRRVGTHALDDGDVIRVGGTLLLWQRLDAPACLRLLQGPLPAEGSRIVGGSHEILRVHDEIRAAAEAKLPVLVLGESGVGKELVAAALHESAGGGPFVPLNCAALPEALAESELFGHARGAFTGASGESAGLFGQAHGGTLFLDEIGEMPLALQAKLLRALATGEVRGVGQRQTRMVDVRLIAATNADLEAAVSAGSFRGDLYARLCGSIVRVPPLKKRRDDVLVLARHFLLPATFAIEPDAAEALLVYGWPWNVRELEHALLAAAPHISRNGSLTLSALPAHLRSAIEDRGTSTALDPGVQVLLGIRRDATPSREELERVLDHFRGNVSRVAAFFDRERRQIYRWATHFGLNVTDARTLPAGADPLRSADSEGDG